MNDLFQSSQLDTADAPVACLGQSFPSDAARREHFRALLAEKLKDPAFRAQPGFPKGSDEAILAMSDPPYYTACPNPWAAEFVECYGTAYDPEQSYAREPLAIDGRWARRMRCTRRTPITPRCRTWPSCRRSCTTRHRAIWCWTASRARA